MHAFALLNQTMQLRLPQNWELNNFCESCFTHSWPLRASTYAVFLCADLELIGGNTRRFSDAPWTMHFIWVKEYVRMQEFL